MGVAGELQVHTTGRDPIGEMRLVGEQHYGFRTRNFLQGVLEIVSAGHGVINACEPQAGAILFQSKRLIAQKVKAAAAQDFGYEVGVGVVVMIAEHGKHAQAGTQRGKNLRAGFSVVGGGRIVLAGKGSLADEVAGENHEIGLQLVGQPHGGVDDTDVDVTVVVEIAELDDAQAVKMAWQASQADFQAGNLQPGG